MKPDTKRVKTRGRPQKPGVKTKRATSERERRHEEAMPSPIQSELKKLGLNK